MSLLKRLFLFAAIFCCSYCRAQQFESIQIDNTIRPSPTYVRIKFPHQGFMLTDIIQRDPLIYPAATVVSFVFRECTGDTGINYFDTGLMLYIDSVHRLTFYLVLDTNTKDTNCVQRGSWSIVDTVRIVYPIAPTSVVNMQNPICAIYPNPITAHRLIIETSKVGSELSTATIYSLQGSLVASYNLTDMRAEIELPSNTISGNYLLQIRLENGVVERKIITVQ